jgi:hypothetical protein
VHHVPLTITLASLNDNSMANTEPDPERDAGSEVAALKTFPQVDHHQASGELARIYEDIHGTLRLPWVAFAIRVLSQFPYFVPAAWAALKPQISTRYAERGADLIRRAAIVPGASPPSSRTKLVAKGWTPGQIAELQAALDCLNYGNPKYLLLITAWNEAWNDRNAGGGTRGPVGQEAELLPYGLPEGVKKFHLIDPDQASSEVQALLRRVRDAFLHHGPASDYRVLATWPDYLKVAIEDVLEPVALTAEFDETARQIRAIARDHIRGFAAPAGVSWRAIQDKLSPTEIAGITGLLFLYTRFIADITIAVIRLKQAFEGSESATANKFPT